MRLDGRRVPGRTDLSGALTAEAAGLVPAGPSRELVVEVVAKDPRNTRYAVVVWEARKP